MRFIKPKSTNNELLSELKTYKTENENFKTKYQQLTKDLADANDRINNYEKMITEYDEQNFDLLEQISVLEEKNINLNEIVEIKFALCELQGCLMDSQIHQTNAEVQTDNYTYQDTSIQTEIVTVATVSIQTDDDGLHDQIVSLQNRINLSYGQLEIYNEQVNDLSQVRDKLERKFDELNFNYILLTVQYKELQKDHAKLDSEYYHLLITLIHTEEKIYTWMKELTSNFTQLNKNDAVENDIYKLQNGNKLEHENEHEHENEDKNEHELETDSASDLETESENELHSENELELNSENELSSESELERAFKNVPFKYPQIADITAAVSEELDRIQAAIYQLHEEYLLMEKQLDERKQDFEKLQNDFIEKCTENENQKIQLTDTIEEIKIKDVEIERLKERNSHYEESIKNFSCVTTDLKKKLGYLQDKCSKYEKELVKSQNGHINASKISAFEKEQLQKENEKIAAKLKQLNDQMITESREICQLKQENENLRKEIDCLTIRKNDLIETQKASNSAASSPQLSPKTRKQTMHELIDKRRSIDNVYTKGELFLL